jgi:hypothetical protein
MRARRTAGSNVVLAALLLLPLFVTGCTIGHNPASSPVATTAYGAQVVVDWRGTPTSFWESRAEVVLVADSGIYLRHESTLVFYPIGVKARLRPRDAPGVGTVNLERANSEMLVDLAQYARHPFGLSEEQLKQLARSMGTDSIFIRRAP